MSVESRRKQREPKTDTEKLLQKEKAKAGLQALAIGPVTGVLGLPSDILDLADMANDAVAKYGEDTVLGQFSKLIKPKLDEVQEKYGREAFDRGFTELTGIKSDVTNPPQMLGELISLGTLAKTGVKVAKTVGETFSDTYKGTKKLFEDSTIPPAGGSKLATVDDAPLPEIKETETLLQKPEKVDTTLKTPSAEDYANLPVINPSVIGLQTEIGKRQAKKFFDLEKNTNKSPEEIFAETGVYRGPDKKLRYELDDRGAKLTKTIKKQFKNFDSEVPMSKLPLGKEFTLEQIFDFDALYKQYDKGILQNNIMYKPIKDLKIRFKKILFNFNDLGGYDPVDDVIDINLNATAFGHTDKSFKTTKVTPKERQARIESTILHEIQHAIQHREGFFSGGNSRDRLNKINPNHKQDGDTNRALLDKARERLEKVNEDARFPIENFIDEKIRLEKKAKSGEEIGEFAKEYLEELKEKVDNLDIPKNVKAKYGKDYENYRKNQDILDDQSRKAYQEYRDIYGEREARLVEDRYQKRKELLGKDDTFIKKLFRGKQDDVDTSLRGDTEFIQEFGGVSPNAKLVKDADGQIVGVTSSKSEFSSKNFKPETIRIGEFPANQKKWFLDGDTVTLYHGTSKENLEKVVSGGLKGDADGLVYTSPDVHSATGYGSVKGGEKANKSKSGKQVDFNPDSDRITLKYEIPKNEFLKLIGDPNKTQRSISSKTKLFNEDSKQLFDRTKDNPQFYSRGEPISPAGNYYEGTEIRFKEGDIDKYLVGAVERVRTPKVQQEMISVFPKPERMFPKGEAPKGGDYLNPATGEVLTDRNVSSANIKINPDGKPSFKVSDDNVESVGTTGKGNSQIKTNLFKKKAGWKWTDTPSGMDSIETLVSVTHKGKHFYTVETDFTKGVNLKKYPNSPTEPKLRPTVVGQIELGQPIGEISVRGKPHKVYDKIKAFNEGGIAMKEQMELFQEGGLQEEGGTIDPVSGNDVPPGATQEEVRDDIPAQLSEGEFVFPADVVRYIGLEKLMQLRQEAKAGLKRMEEMGQMGNADEATLPDDIPFTVDDLDTREETEEEKIEMAKGGVIEAQAGTFVSPTFGTFTQPSSVVSQFQNTAPNVQLPNTVPMNTGQQIGGFNVPQVGGTQTFQDLVGRSPGQYDEFRKYVNEAGMILNIPFKDGEPLYPVPEGYTFQDPEKTKVEDPSVVNVKPQTARVESVSGDDSPDPEMEAGLGGGRVDIGGQTFATQFDFSGNLIGIANVEDALRTGRADFFAPNPELRGLLTDEIKGNLARLGGGPFGALGRNLQEKGFLPKSIPLGAETIKKGDIASKQLRTYDASKAGMRPGDEPMKKPSLAELRKGELSAKEIDAKKLEDEEKDIAGAGLGQRSIVMKNMGEKASTMSESEFQQTRLEMDRATIEDRFSQDAQNDISLAGGTVSVDLNPNGTSYSKNADGSFTHEDGTTVNFTDSQGNPGNAPPPGDYSPPSYDTGTQDSAFDTTSSFSEGVTESGGMFTAKGGFIKKPKPKVKKMKRGGLASRK
jgi:hypothetical protein